MCVCACVVIEAGVPWPCAHDVITTVDQSSDSDEYELLWCSNQNAIWVNTRV
jgi:hypothetical protein